MVFSKNFVRYFALKNGFFSRECQIDKSKLQKLQENMITEQKDKKYVIWIIFALLDHFWANFLGRNIGVWGVVQSNAV